MSSGLRRSFPPRPYIPPIVGGCIGSVLAAGIGMSAAWRAYAPWQDRVIGGGAPPNEVVGLPWGAVAAVLCASACAAIAAWALHVRMGRATHRDGMRYARNALLWFSICATTACCTSALALRRSCDEVRALLSADRGSLELAVAEDPSISEFGAGFAADVLCDGRRVACVQVSADEAYPRGTRLDAVLRIEPLEADEWGRSRFLQGHVADARAVHIVRAETDASKPPVFHIRDVVLNRIDPATTPARALVAGTVCGYTTELDRLDCSEAFAKTGLTHLVAVSGSHLALIAGAIEVLLGWLGVRRSRALPAVCVLMAAYVVFTGGAPSAVRSFLMVVASMASMFGGRRSHPLSGLLLTIVVLVTVRPGLAFDLGFQLSAASVLFISLFFRYLAFHIEVVGAGRNLSESLALTLGAQWATVPLTARAFGQISLVAPVANLAAAPLMAALLAIGLAVAPVAYLVPDGRWLFEPAAAIANIAIFLAEALSQMPFSAMASEGEPALALVFWGAAAAVYAAWARFGRAALLAGCAAVLMPAAAGLVYWERFAPAELVVLDVGQADCILVREGSSTLLVDAGEDEQVLEALARNHVAHVDAVVITHWHADHYGGLDEIVGMMGVDEVYLPSGMLEAAPQDVHDTLEDIGLSHVHEVRAGDAIEVGGFVCRVVLPSESVDGAENEDSLCLDVEHRGGGLDAFLTGDAEAPVTEPVAARVGDVDVLKLGHHGSKVSVSAPLLAALDPELCVASAGEGNSYGHPDPACKALVEEHGACFACTMDSGDVHVRPASREQALGA